MNNKQDCLTEFSNIKAALFRIKNVYGIDVQYIQRELWMIWPECLKQANANSNPPQLAS